tara:strand:+ start:640 stop:1059 length:420 start_codon:yes stop_codon:yes gene_type:complete
VSATEKYIFEGEIEDFFNEKVHRFHDEFVDEVLLCGVDLVGTPLDQIKMTKNYKYKIPFYEKIVGGLLKFPPDILACAIDRKNKLVAELFFTKLDNNADVIDTFLLQNVYQWESDKYYCSQVWKLRDSRLDEIKEYWKN